MREWGWDDEKILKKLKKSGQWLRDTESMLNGLGDHCLEAVYSEKVNRTGAMLLVKIEDPEERRLVCDDCTQNSVERSRQTIEKRKFACKTAERGEELAELRLADAEFRGDSTKIEVARSNLTDAVSDAEKRRLALEAAEKSSQAGQRDVRLSINNIRPRSNRSQNVAALRPAKSRTHFAEPIQSMIDRDGRDEDGNLVANTTDLQLLKDVIDDILYGRTTSLVGRLRVRLKMSSMAS